MTRLMGVTALFDIGRATEGDGRTIDSYLDWLNGTLKLPLPFIVFLDSTIDPSRVALRPGDRLVRLPFSDLPLAAHLPRVTEICAERHRFVGQDDLTFRLPAYGITVLSKFALLARAAELHPDAGLLWVDAGASRFLEPPHRMSLLAERLLRKRKPVFTITGRMRKAMWRARLLGPKDYVTTCTPLVLGCSFYLPAPQAAPLARLLDELVSDWLARGLWDNEQVALADLLLRGKLDAHLIPIDKTACWLLRVLFDDQPHHKLIPRMRNALRLRVLA